MVRSFLAHSLILLALVGLAPAARTADAEPMPKTDPAPLTETDRGAIRSVIEAQLAAFRADDGATAFSFASPSIQRQFGNPANFLTMVRTAYLPVYRPREVQFSGLIEDRAAPVQPVLLVGPELEVVTAFYVMQKQADGAWRIDGCVLRGSNDQAL